MTSISPWQHWEFVRPQPFNGKGEWAIALLACSLWFMAILGRLSLPEAGSWPVGEKLYDASAFVIFAGLPLFGLATPQGATFAKQVLLPRSGLVAQVWLCLLLALYIGIGQVLQVNPAHFPWRDQLQDLVWPNQFWGNTGAFLAGLFVVARLPFLVLQCRQAPIQLRHLPRKYPQLCGLLLLNTLYLAFHQTPQPGEGLLIGIVYGSVCLSLTGTLWQRRSPTPRLMPFDLWLMVLCIAILYWVSIPSFNFGVFMGADWFVLVVVYGTGLGREHFGYSFQMRRTDWIVLAQTVAIAIAVLTPLAIGSGFVRPDRVASQFSGLKLLTYFALFTLRVGLFEEIFFRSGLMVFLRDQIQQSGRDPLSPLHIAGFS
ncbi:MAG: hypothetical protein WCD18_05265, partial [Thermosynechococcaceae cyanobacterium]